MIRAHMRDTIAQFLRLRPFHINMTSGERFDVTDPELVAVGQSQFNVLQPGSDRFLLLRFDQIVAIESRGRSD